MARAVIPDVIVARGALMFRAGMVVDGDGDPRCYAPAGSGLVALDYLANAMNGDKFVGVACVNGEPVVQGPSDPAPGYYVSPTSLCDRSRLITDPRRYVCASAVPYIAVCPELRARGVLFGDVCMLLYHDRRVAAVVADGAPHNHYGEASIAAARSLGIPPSPKNGGVASGVTYVIFPGSTCGWPRDLDGITGQAARLFAALGGPNAIPWIAAAA